MKTPKILFRILAINLVLGFAANIQAQNFLMNGSFELPQIQTNTLQNNVAPTNWSLLPGNINSWLMSYTGGFWPQAEDGLQYFDVGNGGISQSFSIATPGQYQLSWYQNAALGWGPANCSFTLVNSSLQTVASNTVTVVIGTNVWQQKTISLNLSAADTYTISFSGIAVWTGADAVIDNVSLVPLFQIVQSTPLITWTNPAAITYGTALSSNQLNATANVLGSFAYNPTNGAVLNIGTNTLYLSFTPNDTIDYSSVTGSVRIVVSASQPTINILNIQNTISISSTNLWTGLNYQIQSSSDLINWTNQGSSFTATNAIWQSTNYWNVNNWNHLFLRLQLTP